MKNPAGCDCLIRRGNKQPIEPIMKKSATTSNYTTPARTTR